MRRLCGGVAGRPAKGPRTSSSTTPQLPVLEVLLQVLVLVVPPPAPSIHLIMLPFEGGIVEVCRSNIWTQLKGALLRVFNCSLLQLKNWE
jgi:hypothetical protein